MTGSSVSAVTACTAHREWASRPPDERYASVQALYEAARARHARLEERDTATFDLRTEAVDTDDVVIRNTSDRTAALTHWSFGQLATIAGAPPSYLRTLPASIASTAINYGLQLRDRRQNDVSYRNQRSWLIGLVSGTRDAPLRWHLGQSGICLRSVVGGGLITFGAAHFIPSLICLTTGRQFRR